MNKIIECDGGCAMPASSLGSTLGVGNAVPASSAAMTGADQTGNSCIGSGDKWSGFGSNSKKKKYVVGTKEMKSVKVHGKVENMEEAKTLQNKYPGSQIYVTED